LVWFVFLYAGLLLLVFFPAPAALGKFLTCVVCSTMFGRRPSWACWRGDVVDALNGNAGVIPGKVATEVFVGLGIIEKGVRIRGARLTVLKADSRTECHWAVRGRGKQLGQAVIFTQTLDGLGFHLAGAIMMTRAVGPRADPGCFDPPSRPPARKPGISSAVWCQATRHWMAFADHSSSSSRGRDTHPSGRSSGN